MRRAVVVAAAVTLPCLSLLACTVTEPAIYEPGGYGAQAVTDDQGNRLLSEGDTGEDGLDPEVNQPEPADDAEGASEDDVEQLGEIFPAGTMVETLADLNLRSGPGVSFDALRVMPEGSAVKVLNGVPQEGFLQVEHNGLSGYASYRYLREPSDETPAPGGSSSSGGSNSGSSSSSGGGSTPPPAANWRTRAIEIAAGGVGLSYWWGGGRLYNGTVTPSVAGSCSGSCPNCTHRGNYGADCSGYVAKAWVVPASNNVLDQNTHPYDTGAFYSTTGNGQWSNISKAAVKVGDAFVYRSGGAGHIFIYEKGDAWGKPWAYESRNCAGGVVYNVRSAGSAYKAITLNRD